MVGKNWICLGVPALSSPATPRLGLLGVLVPLQELVVVVLAALALAAAALFLAAAILIPLGLVSIVWESICCCTCMSI